jgi:hypothetical protein
VVDRPGGFHDAVNVSYGHVSELYLSLGQGLVVAALGNALAADDVRRFHDRTDGLRNTTRSWPTVASASPTST